MRNRPHTPRPPHTTRIPLTHAQHHLLSALLPKQYALVEADQWNAFQIEREALQKQRRNPSLNEEQCALIQIERPESRAAVAETQFPKIEAVQRDSSSCLPETKKQESKSASQGMKSEAENPQGGSEQKVIEHLLGKIINHPEFVVILNAKTQPTAQQQVAAIQARLADSYSLVAFQKDVELIFTTFFEQIGHNQRTTLFRNLANTNIDKYVKRHQLQQEKIAKLTEEARAKAKLEMLKIEQAKLEQAEKEQTRNEQFKEKRDEESSREQQSDPENIKARLRPETEPKRQDCISLSDMAALGYNIYKLSSVELKWICLNFITGSREKIAARNSSFTLDIEALTSEQFWKLEAYVKKKLSTSGIAYERAPQEEDDNFVIEDDDDDE